MSLPTSGTVYLETSSYGNGKYARVARSRTSDVLTVQRAYYDHQNFLEGLVQQVRGDSPMLIGADFDGPNGTESLHYHPGVQKLLTAKAGWNVLRAVWSVGKFVELVVDAKRGRVDPEAEQRIPQDVRAAMATRGLLQAPGRVLAAHSYLHDSSIFPVEGYYYEPPGSELLITGKIRASDIR